MEIYCVNLKTSVKRRERMISRFYNYKILDRVTFVEGVDASDPIIDKYNEGRVSDEVEDLKWRRGMGCFLGHMKAIKAFLKSTHKNAFICEDDIMLHNNFQKRFDEIWLNVPENPTLVTLTYMMSGWDGTVFTGKHPELKNVMTISPNHTWGAQMYWISREYAEKVIDLYDRPFKQLDEEGKFRSAEVIVRASEGYLMYPPLVIEDGIDSDRAPEDLPYHHRHFKYWGYQNFSKGEDSHECPIYFL